MKASLNVELPKVQERRVDLVLLLEDDSILHADAGLAGGGRVPAGLRIPRVRCSRPPARHCGSASLVETDHLRSDAGMVGNIHFKLAGFIRAIGHQPTAGVKAQRYDCHSMLPPKTPFEDDCDEARAP